MNASPGGRNHTYCWTLYMQEGQQTECYMNKNKVLVVMLLSEVIRKFHPIDGYLATQHTI